jgi:hypothetical protein
MSHYDANARTRGILYGLSGVIGVIIFAVLIVIFDFQSTHMAGLIYVIPSFIVIMYSYIKLTSIIYKEFYINNIPDSVYKLLSFPPGHPLPGVMYIANPANSSVYYSAESFHAKCFENKCSELQTLLRALGASEYSIEVVSAIEKDKKAKSPIFTKAGVAGTVDGTVSYSSSSRLVCEWKGDGSPTPHVPDGLYWLASEPTWNDIIKARMQAKTKSINVYWEHNNDYGVKADVRSIFDRVQPGASFDFHEFSAKKCKIECVF